MSTRPNSREKILDAAEDVVKENGAAHLTLDAVSAKAGVSKGGLLYHFPTKDAMVRAMVQRIAGSFVDAREKMSASLPSSPGRVLKAYILSEGMFRQKKVLGIGSAILASGARDADLLDPVQEFKRELFDKTVSSGIRKAFANVILLAWEGLHAREVLGILDMTPQERQAVIQEMLRLVEEEEARMCK